MVNVKFLAKSAIIAALYVVITWLIAPISYGAIQFRISEILILLVVFNHKYSVALVIGCFVANTTSSLGWYDMVFGTLATLISVLIMSRIKNIFISASIPVIANAFIIAFELGLAFDMLGAHEFFFNVLTVGAGELIVLYVLGIPVFLLLKRNKAIVELLELNVN